MEVNGCFGLCHKVAYKSQMVVAGQRVFFPMPKTACSVMETPNLRRYETPLGAVPLPSKTSNHIVHTACNLNGALAELVPLRILTAWA